MSTTDLATTGEEPTSAPVALRTDTVRALADFAVELDAATRIAEAVCRTNFVPEAYRGKAGEATAAILTGHELGFSPMAALRAFYPAPGGRAEMYARAMQAVALAAGHDVWVAEQNDDYAIVRGWRKGTPKDRILEVKWDQERVRKAGLMKDKGNHEKFPQQMMASRGIAEMSRLVAPAELHGIYATEERDPITVEVTVGTPAPSPVRTVTAADILDEPAASEPVEKVEPSTVDAEAVPMITDVQRQQLADFLKQTGRTGAKAAAFIADVIRREAASPNDLTEAEAGQVIDLLEAELGAQP
jgi:hypothetical protein